MSMERTFGFEEFRVRGNRAAARALIGLGMQVSRETKNVTDVITGNLRRSVHIAPTNYDGSDDAATAAVGDMLNFQGGSDVVTETAYGPMLEVGSWLPYACVEWIGRGHPGVTQGLEMVRGYRADSIVRQAFAEEGIL